MSGNRCLDFCCTLSKTTSEKFQTRLANIIPCSFALPWNTSLHGSPEKHMLLFIYLHLMLKGEMGRVLQLLGRSSGFVVAPTHRPCTKGLWMWSAPLKCTAPDGSEYNLLLLDSEGIDAYDQTVCLNPQEYLCDNVCILLQ